MYKHLIILFLTAMNCYSYTNFVLISAPGSGKGTFSQYLSEKYGYVQICPGDIIRTEIREQTKLGKQIQPAVERGDFTIDENIICTLMKEYITKAISEVKPFIIDGFPRTIESFNFLHTLFTESGLTDVCFIQIEAPDAICIDRISTRLMCTECSHVYNSSSAKPQKENVCDICNKKLTMRSADTKTTAERRITFFHTQIEPLFEQAKNYYTTIVIDGQQSIDKLTKLYDTLVHNKK